MKHLSLFSGIGGIDLAAEWAGFETIAFVEIDKYCQKVLRKHWPDVPIIERVQDVTKERITEIMADTESGKSRQSETGDRGESIERRSETLADSGLLGQAECQEQATGFEQQGEVVGNSASKYSDGFKDNSRDSQQSPSIPESGNTSGEKYGITLISGGFPCQPHSVAGKRKGSVDERNLWPEFRRVIGEIRPRWVLAENVPGIFSSDAGWFFGTILNDLAEMGYSVGWATYGAVDVGALHRRNRVFIVGYSENGRGWRHSRTLRPIGSSEREYLGNSQLNGLEEQGNGRIQGRQTNPVADSSWWAIEPNVGRVAHGVPSRVDRLKCLGNAVVPQQIYPVLNAMAEQWSPLQG